MHAAVQLSSSVVGVRLISTSKTIRIASKVFNLVWMCFGGEVAIRPLHLHHMQAPINVAIQACHSSDRVLQPREGPTSFTVACCEMPSKPYNPASLAIAVSERSSSEFSAKFSIQR